MKNLVCALMASALLGITAPSIADDRGGPSIAVGSDWSHGTGAPSQKKMLDLRYEGRRWNHWSASFSTFGTGGDSTSIVCTELFQSWRRWQLGFGPCLKTNGDDDVVSGDFAYQVRLAYTFKRQPPSWLRKRGVESMGAELIHWSNCSSFLDGVFRDCIVPGFPRGDQPNDGYNFGVFRLRGRLFR